MNILKSCAPLNETLMQMAKTFAEMRSKDPKTKVGACIYDPTTNDMFFGYNGFPQDIPDHADWWHEVAGAAFTKHELVIHAEANAIRKATRANACLQECRLLITHFPCVHCITNHIIPSRIREVIAPAVGPSAKHAERLIDLLYRAGVLYTPFTLH